MRKRFLIIAILTCLVCGVVSFNSIAPTNLFTTESPTYQLYGDDVVPDQPADAAKIVVEAQEKAVVGELVRLDVSKSVAEAFEWSVVPETADFEAYDNGKKAVFSARKPGNYLFIVACAYKSTVNVTKFVVTIEGSEPIPPPVSKIPTVAKPDEGASLLEWLPYWCSKSERPKGEVLKLAKSFESIAAQISAGVLTDITEIVNTTSKANREALAGSVVNWLPVLQNIQTELKKRAEIGVLETAEQHATTWREIAKGLKNYAALFGV